MKKDKSNSQFQDTLERYKINVMSLNPNIYEILSYGIITTAVNTILYTFFQEILSNRNLVSV
jgi:hypothetical protein